MSKLCLFAQISWNWFLLRTRVSELEPKLLTCLFLAPEPCWEPSNPSTMFAIKYWYFHQIFIHFDEMILQVDVSIVIFPLKKKLFSQECWIKNESEQIFSFLPFFFSVWLIAVLSRMRKSFHCKYFSTIYLTKAKKEKYWKINVRNVVRWVASILRILFRKKENSKFCSLILILR